MKIGDYVRFEFFRISVPIHISKIIDINYDEQENINLYGTEDGFILTDNNIIKSSPDLEDVLEKDDFITTKDGKIVQIYNIEDDKIYFFYDGLDYIYPYYIKSIVTKEQFEAIKYEIK